LSQEFDLQVLNGILLGDATLMKLENEKRNSRLQIILNEKNLDLIEYLENYFNKNSIKTSKGMIKTRLNKTHYWLGTTTNEFFTVLRKRWYPNNKKIIPKNLKITPKTLAFWFMCDGGSYWITKYKDSKSEIRISTEGYEDNDIDFLIYLLKQQLNIKARKMRSKKYQIIHIGASIDVYRFLRIVEPYIIPSFRYKLKFPILTQYRNKLQVITVRSVS